MSGRRDESGAGENDARARSAAALVLTDASQGLLAQIRWFNRMRFAAVFGMVLAAQAAAIFDLAEDPRPLFVIASIALAVNLGYVRWFRRLRAERASLRRHVDLQIGVDLLILTSLLHFSGGVTNPLAVSYVFHTFIAAFLRSMRAAIVVACVSMLLVGGLALLEYGGWIPHHPLTVGWTRLTDVTLFGLASWLATIGLVLLLSIYFVSTIVRQLAARDQALLGLSRQLALSEKLASIGTLAAGVSHEINNPVGVIRTKANVLRYRIADGDPPELLIAEVDTIEKHTKRIATITEGLLAFSRETPFELRPIRVDELVAEAAELVRVPFGSAGLELEVRADAGDLRIAGSPNHLLQVLVNVLLNAKDASPRGARVTVTTTTDEREVRIRIVDQGPGIPDEVLGKIFDPFFTTKDVDRGTGLGLSLSHGIVLRHGGRIEVQSQPGEGAAFTIALPRRALA